MDTYEKIDYSAFHEAGFYVFLVKAGIFFSRGIL